MSGNPVTAAADAVSVIVPCREIDALTERCVGECARLWPAAEILIVPDVPPPPAVAAALPAGARTVVSGAATIAAKRNLAAHRSRRDILAFIDSDAYPETGWLDNAVRHLRERDDVGAVGGPNLPPPDQRGWRRVVGGALCSVLVSGKWTYRKVPGPARLVDDLPSCNLVVRRAEYLAMGGMNEALVTGEDMDFCARLVAAERPVLYTPDVTVYHRNRGLRGFAVQRFVYGASVPDLWRHGLRLNYLLISLPAAFVAFLLSAPLAALWPAWAAAYLGVLAVYGAIVAVEAVRCAPGIAAIPATAIALVVGNLVPGAGTVAQLLGIMPPRDRLYRNTE